MTRSGEPLEHLFSEDISFYRTTMVCATSAPHASAPRFGCAEGDGAASSRGFGVMEWTGKIISQGTLVKGVLLSCRGGRDRCGACKRM